MLKFNFIFSSSSWCEELLFLPYMQGPARWLFRRKNTAFVLKQLISILLLFLLAWQGLYKAGFIIYWKINQSYISQALCENKDKPKMHCDGKCYLKKQLEKIDEQKANQNNIPFAILKLKPVDNFIVDYSNFDISKKFLSSHQPTAPRHYSFVLLPGHYNSPFHPPEFI